MLTKLIDVCLINKYPQLDASGLEDLITSTGNVKLLPSSKDYDWVSNYETSKDYLCDGEVITLGKARYANIKYYKGLFVSANNVIVESKNQNIVLTKFLYYYCLKNNKNFYVEGTTYPKFDMPSFSNSIVDVPSISEQKSIIGSLDTILHLIENEEKQLKLYDELIKSRFIEMFDNKGYPILKWNDVFNTTTGKLDSNAMVEGGQYPFFTCAKEVFAIDKYAFDQEALLLAGNNAAGKYDVKYYKGKFNAYQRTYVLDLKQNWSYQLFRYQLEDKLEWLREQSKGCNTRYITLKILGELEFIIPPFEDQIAFERFCNQIDKSKFIVQKHLDLMNELLEKKMEEYFGGK